MQFNSLSIKDKKIIEDYINKFEPESCEYNFANLIVWQKMHVFLWAIYQNKLLLYDSVFKRSLMPIGGDIAYKKLAYLSLNMKKAGLSPDFYLATNDYIKQNPKIKEYYTIREERDYSEYIYDVNKLYNLNGKKLHKKRNLISQFKRIYPDFKIEALKQEHKEEALELAKNLLKRQKDKFGTLYQEYSALELSFDYFDVLELDGLLIKVKENIIAFCVLRKLNNQTYNTMFEKSDNTFKGAPQTINHETAKYLKGKCQYINREQDLGIKGLRHAKMSYQPVKLITPCTLIFTCG